MTDEQRKVRKFYKDLQGWKPDTIGTWIGAGFLVMFMLFGCAIPAQEMLSLGASDADMMGWIMVLMFGPLAGFLYLRPYTSITEMVYTNEAKNVRIIDKLKYLPISLKEIRKMKVIYLLKFYGKIAPFCMGLQFLTSMYSYNEITWKNVLYIFILAFVWPVVANLPMILAEKGMEIPINETVYKHGKWIIVLLIVFVGILFIFFPRNLKDLLLDGENEENVEIIVHNIFGEEYHNYELTETEKQAVLDLFEEKYVRINPFKVESVNEDCLGFYVGLKENEGLLFFFTDTLIQYHEVQYIVYGDAFFEEFIDILERE